MFTGLVEQKGQIRRVRQQGPGSAFTLSTSREFVNELVLGESVAIDGACMTVTQTDGDTFTFDASAESLARTTLGQRRVGDHVHLERAMRLGDRIGGHMVSGHIDGLGVVAQRKSVGTAIWMRFRIEDPLLRYLIEKGSVAVDGISLTVNELFEDGFSVMLIPHTQSVVHLHEKTAETHVNLEMDQIGKYVERLLTSGESSQYSSAGLSEEKLRELGYLS